ncbi:hypothetical protein CEE45_14770 [Candidatus Heimdallarchaeota archaeon B3_Heim]|nr:MAG: hypothetical protein CEE45_14770 [Candidatus Heimdallarchaeota archaeon B3_Heim]
MRSNIAWIRLTIYMSSSLLLLTEIYRLSLILLRFIIIAPPLMAFLQYIMQWGLLLGFSGFTFGLYRVLGAHPPVLDLKDYSVSDLIIWARVNLIISILLGIKILLPPTPLVSPEIFILFSTLVSASWLLFYSLLVMWIIIYWKIILRENHINAILFNKRIAIHLILGTLVTGYWFLESASLIIFQNAISAIDPVNLTYIIFLILFLFNQNLLFFRVTKFSYLIYG